MGEAVCSIARGSRGQRLRGPALQPAPAPVNFGVTGCNLGLRHQTASHQGWEPTLQPAQKNTVGCIEVARAPAPSHSLPRRLALSNFLDPLPTFCPSPPYPHRTPCPPLLATPAPCFLSLPLSVQLHAPLSPTRPAPCPAPSPSPPPPPAWGSGAGRTWRLRSGGTPYLSTGRTAFVGTAASSLLSARGAAALGSGRALGGRGPGRAWGGVRWR